MAVSNRIWLTRVLAATGAMAVLMSQTACVTGRQFREAALPSLESGVSLMLDGVVDGLFATIEVETPANADNLSATDP